MDNDQILRYLRVTAWREKYDADLSRINSDHKNYAVHKTRSKMCVEMALVLGLVANEKEFYEADPNRRERA